MNFFYTTMFMLFSFFGNILAQENSDSPLYQKALELDRIIFDLGFNQCDLTPTENLLAEDVAFYHDVAGSQNKAQFMTAIRENICGPTIKKPIRKLAPETLEVYPMKNNGIVYGMIAKGEHDFYIKEPNKALYQTGKALFTILWIKENNTWKAKTIYSYHHQAIE